MSERLVTERDREDMEAVLASIMTAEEYSGISHASPYVFELKAGGIELHYFGASHEQDPQDPMFAELEVVFTKANPDMVFVEGMSIRGNRKIFNEEMRRSSKEEVIKDLGEPGFTLQLALKKGAEWHSPEPSKSEMYADLQRQGFSNDEIFAWHFFHILPQYHRLLERKGFREYVQHYTDGFKKETNWEGFDYSYEHAMQLGEQILGSRIDVEHVSEPTDLIDPIPRPEKQDTQTVLNRVNRATSLFRDRHIVREIARVFQTHKKVFVVYGHSHAVMQEPALRKLFDTMQRT